MFFGCQGIGHVARSFPNKVLISRDEYNAFFAQETRANQESSYARDEHIKNSSFSEQQLVCKLENEPHTLILRRSLLSTIDVKKEDEQRSNLSHSNCLINGKSLFFSLLTMARVTTCVRYL